MCVFYRPAKGASVCSQAFKENRPCERVDHAPAYPRIPSRGIETASNPEITRDVSCVHQRTIGVEGPRAVGSTQTLSGGSRQEAGIGPPQQLMRRDAEAARLERGEEIIARDRIYGR